MSGQFTIGQPIASTGKAHMVAVKCDLCPGEAAIFDPRKVENPQNEITRIVREHVCTKKKPEKKRKRFTSFVRPFFVEYETGTRRRRLGPPEKEDTDVTL